MFVSFGLMLREKYDKSKSCRAISTTTTSYLLAVTTIHAPIKAKLLLRNSIFLCDVSYESPLPKVR